MKDDKKWYRYINILQNYGAGQIEDTVEMVEDVAEMVEDVAEAVDKASFELVKKLPEDGFLKEAVTFVGNISKEVADDAEDAIEFIDKVGAIVNFLWFRIGWLSNPCHNSVYRDFMHFNNLIYFLFTRIGITGLWKSNVFS